MNHKKMAKLTSFAAAAAVLLSSAVYLPKLNADAAGLSGLDAKGITSQMTIGWNLGNSLDANSATIKDPAKSAMCWGNPEPTKELFETVKAGGFNTVRIPTTWYPHISYNETEKRWDVDDEWMDYVKMTVDYAYELDMFVILNVHHENWVNVAEFTDATYADASAKLEGIWTEVAQVFADYDQHLIFEGMNEPRQTGLGSSVEWGTGDTDSRAYINNLNKVFVDTIRKQGSAANSERLLMLPGYCASSDASAIRAIEIPANSGNVALSVHAYSPYFFTMDTSEYANHEFPGKSGWGEDYEYALNSLFSTLTSISSEKNAPIIIGEFSASDFNNTDSRVAWAKCYLGNAKKAGIPCVLWDNNAAYNGTGEAHGYVYRLTNTWYPNSAPVIEAMMGVYGIKPTLPEYQEYVPPTFDWANIPVGEDWIEVYKPEKPVVLDAWDNVCDNNIGKYLNENYELVLVYQSANDPYLVMQDTDDENGWHQLYSSAVAKDFMLKFTYDDVAETLKNAGKEFKDMENFFISAANGELTVYGLYAIPLKSAETTTKPAETTTKPAETTTKPAETTTKPAETTTKPAETTTKPVQTTTKPVQTTTKPAETTTKPVQTTTKPAETTTKPVETTTKPVQTTTKPVETTTSSTETTTTPAKVTKYGDANCDGAVSILDVIALNRNLLIGEKLSDAGILNADVNKNGKPDTDDSLMILKSLIDLVSLPTE